MTPFWVILDSYVGHIEAKTLFPAFRNRKNEIYSGLYCSRGTVLIPFYNVKHCKNHPYVGHIGRKTLFVGFKITIQSSIGHRFPTFQIPKSSESR